MKIAVTFGRKTFAGALRKGTAGIFLTLSGPQSTWCFGLRHGGKTMFTLDTVWKDLP